jgi:hypothetical protein
MTAFIGSIAMTRRIDVKSGHRALRRSRRAVEGRGRVDRCPLSGRLDGAMRQATGGMVLGMTPMVLGRKALLTFCQVVRERAVVRDVEASAAIGGAMSGETGGLRPPGSATPRKYGSQDPERRGARTVETGRLGRERWAGGEAPPPPPPPPSRGSLRRLGPRQGRRLHGRQRPSMHERSARQIGGRGKARCRVLAQ